MKQIPEEYKTDLANLTVRSWLQIEEALQGVETDNRLNKMCQFLIGESNPTMAQLNQLMTECKWLTEQQSYVHQPITSIKLDDDEEFIIVRDLNDFTVSQYLSYETYLKQLNKHVNNTVNLCISLLKKENETWDLTDEEFERRFNLMLNGSVLNMLNIVPFYQSHLSNLGKDTQFYLLKDQMGREVNSKEKKNLTRIGDLWERLSVCPIMFSILRNYLKKKLG